MGEQSGSTARFLWTVAAVVVIVPVVLIGIVSVRTWVPLRQANESLEQLDALLGPEASYTPAPDGPIPPERMEVFLNIRAELFPACGAYAPVLEGVNAVAALDSTDTEARDVAGTSRLLGKAAFEITPFLARFFELRNRSLLEARMGLEEYAYIYALAYHDRLLSAETRAEVFSNGDALSPEASVMLRGCLSRQAEAVSEDRSAAITAEHRKMAADPGRLLWQDGLPAEVAAGVSAYRDRLDRLFCPATAGLEMDHAAGRALLIALY